MQNQPETHEKPSRQALAHNELPRRYAELSARYESLKKEFEDFAYIISHDLQAPLRSVVNYSRLLYERYGAQCDVKEQKYFDYIIDGGTRMQDMIEGLLLYSRIKADKNARTKIPLKNLLQKALQAAKNTISESGAIIHIPDALPEIYGHEGPLLQAISEILGNAIKFRSAGVAPEIHIKHESRNGNAVIVFTDNGIGFREDQCEEVFKVFRRLNKPSEYEGLGMGLAMVKKIMACHGGSVKALSGPGQGCRISLSLPQDHHGPENL